MHRVLFFVLLIAAPIASAGTVFSGTWIQEEPVAAGTVEVRITETEDGKFTGSVQLRATKGSDECSDSFNIRGTKTGSRFQFTSSDEKVCGQNGKLVFSAIESPAGYVGTFTFSVSFLSIAVRRGTFELLKPAVSF